MNFYTELENAMINLEDETARHKVKLVIEGEWEDLWGTLTISDDTRRVESYESCQADSIMSCIIELVKNMVDSRAKDGTP
jgi:hypothetical protein